MARSCEPPADEWPVSPSGIRVITAPATSSAVHDQRSTAKLASDTTAASTAVQRHADAVLIRLAKDHSRSGSSCSDSR